MILNIIVPHLSALLELLLNYTKRCFDSGCSCGKRTKKVLKKEYMELYVGPYFHIDIRYAQILTSIFVCMVYSAGMPILYLCVFLFSFFAYYVDKFLGKYILIILVLRFYRTPPKYDPFIAKLFYMFIFFALIWHYGFAIWIYGNPTILKDNNGSALDDFADSIKNIFDVDTSTFAYEVIDRMTLPHNVLCLIYLLLLALIFILRLSIYEMVEICCSKIFYKELIKKKIEERNLEVGLGKIKK